VGEIINYLEEDIRVPTISLSLSLSLSLTDTRVDGVKPVTCMLGQYVTFFDLKYIKNSYILYEYECTKRNRNKIYTSVPSCITN
jgi:hypothetical protein